MAGLGFGEIQGGQLIFRGLGRHGVDIEGRCKAAFCSRRQKRVPRGREERSRRFVEGDKDFERVYSFVLGRGKGEHEATRGGRCEKVLAVTQI